MRVLEFSDKLREMGVDAELDQYQTRPPQGWPLWSEEQLRAENSKYVLMICTSTYRARIENRASADEGRGVYWEGSAVYQYLYSDKSNTRFIPILFDGNDENIPLRLKGYTRYLIKKFDLSDEGFENLYRELTGQLAVIKGPLGSVVPLPTVVAKPLPKRPSVSGFDTSEDNHPRSSSWTDQFSIRAILSIVISIISSLALSFRPGFEQFFAEFAITSSIGALILATISVESATNFAFFVVIAVCLMLGCSAVWRFGYDFRVFDFRGAGASKYVSFGDFFELSFLLVFIPSVISWGIVSFASMFGRKVSHR